MERDILIGIDASLINCGVAVYEGGNLTLYKGELLDAIDWIRNDGRIKRAIVVIEDANMDKTSFGLWAMCKANVLKFAGKATGPYGIKQAPATLADVQSDFSMAMKRAQDVGKSKAAASILISFFERAKIPVLRIAPSDRDRADKMKLNNQGVKMLCMPTKTTSNQFEQLTGYNGRSNEHNRDAATLIFGRTTAWAEMKIKLQSQTT
jgi:hypothetical protein